MPQMENGIVIMTWKNDTAENLNLVRSAARELASIVVNGQEKYTGQVKQGYGNYGTSVYSSSTQGWSNEHADLTSDIGEEDAVGAKNATSKAESLFLENYPCLQGLKKDDPENIFNKWFAITPSP